MPHAEDFPCPDLLVTEKGTTTTLSQPLLLLNSPMTYTPPTLWFVILAPLLMVKTS